MGKEASNLVINKKTKQKKTKTLMHKKLMKASRFPKKRQASEFTNDQKKEETIKAEWLKMTS